MFFLDTGLPFGTAGHMKDPGIDEAAFTLTEGISVMRKMVI